MEIQGHISSDCSKYVNAHLQMRNVSNKVTSARDIVQKEIASIVGSVLHLVLIYNWIVTDILGSKGEFRNVESKRLEMNRWEDTCMSFLSVEHQVCIVLPNFY